MCDETTLFVAELNSCNVVVQCQAKLHRSSCGALGVRCGNSLQCARLCSCALKWAVAILRTVSTESGEIHVRITTDSFDNPGECVLVPFCACCGIESFSRQARFAFWLLKYPISSVWRCATSVVRRSAALALTAVPAQIIDCLSGPLLRLMSSAARFPEASDVRAACLLTDDARMWSRSTDDRMQKLLTVVCRALC